MRTLRCLLLAAFALLATAGASIAAEITACSEMSSIVEVQKYARAIHIMAMLLMGFGFLMVFVKKYGRSAITATYLLVSAAIPLYLKTTKWTAPATVTLRRLIPLKAIHY